MTICDSSLIQVLLATYNGENYLAEQLDSLIAQQGVGFTVLVRDDGSTDSTLDIVHRYMHEFPGKFMLCEKEGRLGAAGSFDWLLSRSDAPYIAFCDQDDVWSPNKLRILLERMHTLEVDFGKDAPILVHSDLTVVDRDLHRIHSSFWKYSGLDAQRHRLVQLLIANTVTGCALLANRALVKRAAPIPQEATMHDHWFALVAAATGHIAPVYKPLVAYRQHGRNTLGARAWGWKLILEKMITGCGHTGISQLRHQAAALYGRYKGRLDPGQAKIIKGFVNLQESNWLARRFFMLRHGILRAGVVRNIWLLFCVRLAGEMKQK